MNINHFKRCCDFVEIYIVKNLLNFFTPLSFILKPPLRSGFSNEDCEKTFGRKTLLMRQEEGTERKRQGGKAKNERQKNNGKQNAGK